MAEDMVFLLPLLLTKPSPCASYTTCILLFLCCCFLFIALDFDFWADHALEVFAVRLMPLGAMVIQIINEGLFNSFS